MHRLLRSVAIVLLVTVSAALSLGFRNGTGSGWFPLRMGAGGFVTGIDFSDDGKTFVARTDTYGAYLWNGSLWLQLVNSLSMPIATIDGDIAVGNYEIAVAPSDQNRLYMIQRSSSTAFGFFYSTNKGTTWTQSANYTAVYSSAYAQNAGNFKQYGRKMAVDPVNSDVVYVTGITSTQRLQVSTDGGVTFSAVTDVPLSTGNQGQIIAFDRTSGTTNGRTNTIYVSSFGNAIYVSTNAGTSFASTAGGGPTNHVHMVVAGDGILYMTASSPSRVWKYASGAWTDISPDTTNTWQSIAADPFHTDRILVNKSGSLFSVSKNRGASWQGPMSGSTATWQAVCNVGSPGNPSGTASNVRQQGVGDPGWLSWTNACFQSMGDTRFDPLVPDRVWFSDGIGVWYGDILYASTYTSGSQLYFTSQARGIEQLIADQVIAGPGCGPSTYNHDVSVFYRQTPNLFADTQSYNPTTQAPGQKYPLTDGFAVDWPAGVPKFLVAIINAGSNANQSSGYSTDCGNTWTTFGGLPVSAAAGKNAGGIGAANATNFVWAPSDNGNPAYTLNAGTTWTDVDLSSFGVPKSSAGTTFETGWGFASVQINRHTVAADKVNLGTFYMYNSGMSSIANTGLSWAAGTATVTTPAHGIAAGNSFSVTISSANPTAYNGTFTATATSTTQFTFALASDPGATVAVGRYSNVSMFGVYKSTDGGATWTKPYALKLESGGSNSGVNSYLRTVPGYAGHIFFGGGGQTPGTTGPLFYSRDAGSTWTQITNILEPVALGVGAIKSGGDYPSIYMVGYVSNVYGIWRSDNTAAEWATNTVTWTNIGTYPMNSFDSIKTISGDMNGWGRAYIGFTGGGYAYYQNFLLNRDTSPASNDNTPAFMDKVA